MYDEMMMVENVNINPICGGIRQNILSIHLACTQNDVYRIGHDGRTLERVPRLSRTRRKADGESTSFAKRTRTTHTHSTHNLRSFTDNSQALFYRPFHGKDVPFEMVF